MKPQILRPALPPHLRNVRQQARLGISDSDRVCPPLWLTSLLTCPLSANCLFLQPVNLLMKFGLPLQYSWMPLRSLHVSVLLFFARALRMLEQIDSGLATMSSFTKSFLRSGPVGSHNTCQGPFHDPFFHVLTALALPQLCHRAF